MTADESASAGGVQGSLLFHSRPVTGGSIAWYNPVKNTEPPTYKLGLRFYEPIDASPFAESDEDGQEAA